MKKIFFSMPKIFFFAGSFSFFSFSFIFSPDYTLNIFTAYLQISQSHFPALCVSGRASLNVCLCTPVIVDAILLYQKFVLPLSLLTEDPSDVLGFFLRYAWI